MIPIPDRMKHLPLDRRGLPIPVIVARKNGVPEFSINDMDVTNECIRQDRCTVCGGKLFRGRWLVGGGMSALAERGQFADAPAHDECTHYALKVCPYLAAPNWRTTIGKLKAAKANMAAFDLADSVEIADASRPPAFVAIMASKIAIQNRGFGVIFCRPKVGHVQRVEVWRHGRMLDRDERLAFRDQAAASIERDPKHGPIRQDVWQMMGDDR